MATSSPLGLKEKFSTCTHKHKKSKKPKRKYERFESLLLPLPLYEGELGRIASRKSDRQLKDLIKEKNIPTSYLEESGREIAKKEYYTTSIPSAYSRSMSKLKQSTEVEFIKGCRPLLFLSCNSFLSSTAPRIVIIQKDEDEPPKPRTERLPSRLSQGTQRRLEELEKDQLLDADLKSITYIFFIA